MINLTHRFSTGFRVKVYRELNLVRDLDEDTEVSPSSAPLGFWEFHPSSVTLGIFIFFLIFCESLAHCAKSRVL